MTSIDEATVAAEPAPSPPPREQRRDPVGAMASRLLQPRTLVLLLVIGGIAVVTVFLFRPIPPQDGLIGDAGLVWYLSKRTAAGDLPLVDFQHGWNTGGWWVGAALYRLADGSPNVFWFLWAHVSGRMLASSAVAVAPPPCPHRCGGVGQRRLGGRDAAQREVRDPGVLVARPGAHREPAMPAPCRPPGARSGRVRHLLAPRRAGPAPVSRRRLLRARRQPMGSARGAHPTRRRPRC